jgi:hypothetical protein
MMSAGTSKGRPPAAARRSGYAVAAVLNLVMLYLINGRPGWTALPVLTDDATRVLALVNVSLAAGLVVNLVQLIHDPPWVVALGGMVTTAIGAAALLRMWQVFPFEFGGTSFDWALVARVLIALGLIGSVAGFAVQAVALTGARRDPPAADAPPAPPAVTRRPG